MDDSTKEDLIDAIALGFEQIVKMTDSPAKHGVTSSREAILFGSALALGGAAIAFMLVDRFGIPRSELEQGALVARAKKLHATRQA